MNKKHYMNVIEQTINSYRSDLQKIERLQNAFESYNYELINNLEQLAKDYRHETNVGFIDMCIDIVRGEE